MKRDWGSVTIKIQKAFEEHGEMTRKEVCDLIGIDRMYIAAILTRMNRAWKTIPKRIYITRYVYDQDGQKRYPRAVYALGDKPDAKKPKADPKANRKRYDENLRKRMTGISVFHLGMTRLQYQALRKAA